MYSIFETWGQWAEQFLSTDLGINLLRGFAFLFVVLFSLSLLRNLVWIIRYPFFMINWFLWAMYNPIRELWHTPRGAKIHLVFSLLLYSGIIPLWWLLIHIILTPLRFINALYFDLVLYWSVVFCDSIMELIHPKIRYHKSGASYYLRDWFVYFPRRLWNIFQRNGAALLEGILMVGVDTVFPTLTMFHGTSFKGIATNIAQKGQWYVGSGDYAGSGIYFGFYRKTAEHYAKGEDHAMIVARVNVFPCRNSATLPGRLRRLIGNDGCGISSGLGFPWKAIEHWRDHSYAQWFEYCLIQPDKAGEYVRTWRARPICVLKYSFPKRIWGGLSLWNATAGGIGAIVFAWAVIAGVAYAWVQYGFYLL
ncbi:MAG: hypothetical protein CVU48_05535 [Candidatus Cloacimonetes bacterium HGW-Cloacimonetes-1]|jgi:hypothetical protein|nr:MAG: hypothetical protein CVU48_05535 [Candidatus Cloacimonetes bacterium HGW-Cloacimonetes-1]